MCQLLACFRWEKKLPYHLNCRFVVYASAQTITQAQTATQIQIQSHKYAQIQIQMQIRRWQRQQNHLKCIDQSDRGGARPRVLLLPDFVFLFWPLGHRAGDCWGIGCSDLRQPGTRCGALFSNHNCQINMKNVTLKSNTPWTFELRNKILKYIRVIHCDYRPFIGAEK